MDELIGAKVGVLFALLVAALIFGILPLACLLRPTSRTKIFVSFCNTFAGGVFLATFLLHMMPEAEEALHHGLEEFHIHSHFPLSQFIVAIGFFLILIAELLAHRWYNQSGSGTLHALDHHSHETDPLITECPKDATKETESNGNARRASTMSFDASVEHILNESEASILSSLIFLMALTLHSLFEGMAIGLQGSVAGVMEVFLGVVLHKCVIVFSFSLSLLYHKTSPCRVVIYVIILAVMSPLGVAIGIAVPQNTPSAMLANGILQSLASGTFLFIIFFEILPGELQTHTVNNNTIIKLLFMVIGFGVITGLQFMAEHDH